MKDKRKIVISILSILICIMAIGYAFLAQELTINGRASTNFSWKVEITDITQKEFVGGVTEKSKSYTATTANFSVGFTQPGDYIIYDIEITNSGSLDAVISSINVVTDNNPAIIYTTSGLKRGDTIAKNGEKKYLTVKIEYDSTITSQPVLDDNDITIQIDYQQDVGQIANSAFSIGDKIDFAGSKWYVIKNSPIEEDYVTVIKEKILTKKELGNYAYTGSRTSYLGNTVMSYYWDDSCHPDAYGYSSENYNCNNTNNYETSKVKEFLEGTYINTLGTNNLKEVDGYKIRLLTVDELISNLGLVNPNNTVITNNENANVPTWIYLDIGSNPNNYSHEFAYWTMTPFADNSSDVRNVEQMHNREGHIKSSSVIYPNGVRPVINLLKDAIE